MPGTCVIFDIDGTLVDSSGFEDRLYATAVRDVLGNVSIRSDWGAYEHVTDSGILREICRDNGMESVECEYRVRTRFGELVSDHLSRKGACMAVVGAVAFFERLRASSGFEVGIATGGWGHTARMKLYSAGFVISGIPLASSDDDHERIRIMEKCRAQMASADATVYVGDGEWDKRASELLGWRFVGVGVRLRGICRDWTADFSALDLQKSLRL